MKKLVIAFILLLLITAGTVGALQYMGLLGDQPPEGPTEEQRQAEIDRGKVYFVELDPILVPLIGSDKVAATIHIHVKLEITGSDNKEVVLHARPRLSHVFFQDLYGYIPRMLRKSKTLDLYVLKKRLELIANKTVGQGVINTVLIQSVMDVPGK